MGCWSLNVDRAKEKQRRTGASIPAPYGDPVKAPQDILFVPAIQTHTLSFHLRQHVIYATNGWTSHHLGKHRSRARPCNGTVRKERVWTMDGLVRGCSCYTQARHYLAQPLEPATLGEKPHADVMFGSGIEMGTPSFFDAVACADDCQVEFQISAYLCGALAAYSGKWRGGKLANDDVHFERRRVRKAWSGILGISADGLSWALKGLGQVRGKGVDCDWLFGRRLDAQKGVRVHGAGERC